jgi:glycosyltransferase involved in cell wall biosynthesis
MKRVPANKTNRRLIAFHFLSLSQGGVEKMRLILARELLARGWQVDLVVCSAQGDLAALVPEGARVIDLRATRTIKSMVPLVRYLKNERPAVMISSLGHQNLAAIISRLCARAGTWLAVTQHNALGVEAGALTLQHRLLPVAYRIALPFADKVIAVSDGVADDLAERTRYSRNKIAVVYNPAEPIKNAGRCNNFDSHRYFVEREQSGCIVYIAVGRLAYQKGYDLLLSAFKSLTSVVDCRLIICGVGPDREKLEALAVTLDLGSHVDFVGFVEFPASLIACSDIFVLSSRYEGFGNVLVEALSAGTKVVSTDCDFGPSEILAKGRFGRLVSANNESELYKGMLHAINDTYDSAELKKRAGDFSVTAAVDSYMQLIGGQLDTTAKAVRLAPMVE